MERDERERVEQEPKMPETVQEDEALKVFLWQFAAYVVYGMLLGGLVLALPEAARGWAIVIGSMLFIGVGVLITLFEFRRRRRQYQERAEASRNQPNPTRRTV